MKARQVFSFCFLHLLALKEVSSEEFEHKLKEHILMITMMIMNKAFQNNLQKSQRNGLSVCP